MTTLGQRIARRRKELGLEQVELAKMAGITQTSISQIESGRNKQTRHIAKLSAALQCDPLWLETGKDTADKNQNQIEVIEPVNTSVVVINSIKDDRFKISNGLIEIRQEEAIEILKSLQLFVHYQSGISTDNSIKTYINQGTAMCPTIKPNDVVFVDINIKSFDNNGIYAIMASGNIALKRIMILSNGSYKIMSENQKEHPDLELITDSDFKNVSIFGKALAFVHSQLL